MIAVKRQSRPSATRARVRSRGSERSDRCCRRKAKARHAFPANSLSFPGQTRGEGRCRRAFHDALFQFDDSKNGKRNLFFSDGHGEIDMRLRDLERIRRRPAEWRGHRPASDAVRFGVGFPASRAAEKLATFSASTATTFVSGRNVLIASETPASNPPPPTGTTTASTFGTCSTISSPNRALARDDGRIVVTIDVSETVFFRDFVRARLGLTKIFSVQDDGRAQVSGNCSP